MVESGSDRPLTSSPAGPAFVRRALAANAGRVSNCADCGEVGARFGIRAQCRANAPGVYVEERKFASVGLRIRRGGSYHGLALNVNMDLEPFRRINPCGYAGLEMTQLSQLGGPHEVAAVASEFAPLLSAKLRR